MFFFPHLLHGEESLPHGLPVVLDWPIPPLLEVERRVLIGQDENNEAATQQGRAGEGGVTLTSWGGGGGHSHD